MSDELELRMVDSEETRFLALGALLTNQQQSLNSTDINDYEFKIFSQYGDDGIIQYLVKNLNIKIKLL